MSKISLTATLTAADGKSDELRAALVALIAAADEEDGLEVYSVHAADDDPGMFHFFELYRDAEALAAHGSGERMRVAMGAVGACLAGRPVVTKLTPVAAKGLDI